MDVNPIEEDESNNIIRNYMDNFAALQQQFIEVYTNAQREIQEAKQEARSSFHEANERLRKIEEDTMDLEQKVAMANLIMNESDEKFCNLLAWINILRVEKSIRFYFWNLLGSKDCFEQYNLPLMATLSGSFDDEIKCIISNAFDEQKLDITSIDNLIEIAHNDFHTEKLRIDFVTSEDLEPLIKDMESSTLTEDNKDIFQKMIQVLKHFLTMFSFCYPE